MDYDLLLKNKGILIKPEKIINKDEVAFAFPGQGTHYKSMFDDLENETFNKYLKYISEEYESALGESLIELIKTDKINKAIVMQPAIFATEIAMYKSLEEQGIKPCYLVGHSLGELAALCCAGVFNIKDGVKICIERAKILNKINDKKAGFMLAVTVKEKSDFEKTNLENLENVHMAIENDWTNRVYSGSKVDIIKFKKQNLNKFVNSTILPIPYAFHSPLLTEQSELFKQVLTKFDFKKPSTDIKIYSTILGRFYKSSDFNNMNVILAEQLVKPFSFVETIEDLYNSGVKAFVECGPGYVLSNLITKILNKKEIITINTNSKKEQAEYTFAKALTQLNLSIAKKEMKILNNDEQLKVTRISKLTGYPEKLSKGLLLKYDGRQNIRNHFAVSSDIALEVEEILKDKKNSEQEQLNNLSLEEMVKKIISDETGYPIEVLGNNENLEADLGIDSVKQSEIFSKILSKRNVDKPEKELKVNSIQDIINYFSQESGHLYDERKSANNVNDDLQKNDSETIESYLKLEIQKNTGYPIDVLDETSDLEADLGIDSVKQAEIISKVCEHFDIDSDNSAKLASKKTIEEITNVISEIVNGTNTQEVSKIKEVEKDEDILSKVFEIVEKESGYPKDVLEADLDLEADLGIDSVKKGEILSSLVNEFNYEIDSDDIPGNLNTINEIAQYLKKKVPM